MLSNADQLLTDACANVSQTAVKEGILLGLITREHVYLEGPPGVAKTFLAELAAHSLALSSYVYQFHRDTKLSELVGEAVIVREHLTSGRKSCGEGRGEEALAEMIQQRTVPGGIATADICVLDDITRAPGEALNALLRLLNERRTADGERIPLCTAIATANPARAVRPNLPSTLLLLVQARAALPACRHIDVVAPQDYYNEPLDPANIDRFAMQLCTEGLVHGESWEDAGRVLKENLNSDAAPPGAEATGGLSAAGAGGAEMLELGAVHEALRWVALPRPVIGGLLELLRRLVETHGCDEKNSLLTDRTFLVKAPRILQAKALLAGRGAVEPEDLRVLAYMTTYRVPPHVHQEMHEIIDGASPESPRIPANFAQLILRVFAV